MKIIEENQINEMTLKGGNLYPLLPLPASKKKNSEKTWRKHNAKNQRAIAAAIACYLMIV